MHLLRENEDTLTCAPGTLELGADDTEPRKP